MNRNTPPRYRHEGIKTSVDIKRRKVHQFLDGRDSAPFRERDLEEDAVEYILGAFQELPPKADMKIIFWISEETTPLSSTKTDVEAVREHSAYEIERLQRRIREHVRLGQLTVAIELPFSASS
jgi:hypothetical protein